jgi:creatinine amidohydrolase
VNFAELPASKLRSLAHSTPLVFPVAAIEQHGPHLPVWTDSLILGTIIERAQQVIGENVIFAPLLWLGTSISAERCRLLLGPISISSTI